MTIAPFSISHFPFSIGLLLCLNMAAQDYAGHVDPFIGTERSDAKTVWGQFGGTYPGAVAPWGMVQLSPETRTYGEKGYFNRDSSVCYFTCIGHSSGYPEGSHGSVQVTFGSDLRGLSDQVGFHQNRSFKKAKAITPLSVENTGSISLGEGGGRGFAEIARPGYYTVQFADGSQVEMTATTRTGMFRYRAAGSESALITIADAGTIRLPDGKTVSTERGNGLFVFNQPWTKSVMEGQMVVLTFDHVPKEGLLVKTTFSMVDADGSRKNLDAENPGWDFDKIREETYRAWDEELSVVQVASGAAADLAKFYTAMYHSFLIPHIISDVDGRYRGADRKIYQTTGAYEYGKFSTWDSFRSLHPLLCLLKPQHQRDMIQSMLNGYDQRGYLPFAPMTGYHSIPIIADSYVKGITGFDTAKAYRAAKKLLAGDSIPRENTYRYISDGFLNDSIEESVSVTLDYAYNDWTLSVLAEAAKQTDDARAFSQRSFNYRHLFDASTGFMLPRNASGFVQHPGEMGYKEADKWTASWFVPHNVQDLINLSGGDEYFVNHLQEAMKEHVIFDNEPVMHYPYLFSYAGRPDLTCYWVDHIRENCYTPTAGGIPGNDDLGSMSSWYVFSAMGFFPVCPGRPEYVLTTPLFPEITIRQANGKEMKITADPCAIHAHYSSLQLNGKPHSETFITHRQLLAGGSLLFVSSPASSTPKSPKGDLSYFPQHVNSTNAPFRGVGVRPCSITAGVPSFRLDNVRLSDRKVLPHQEIYLYFTVTNTGTRGVFPAIVRDGEQEIAMKKILVEQGSSVTDSIAFRIYREGKHQLSIRQTQLPIQVKPSKEQALVCNRLSASAVTKKGMQVKVEIELQNISGKPVSQTISLYDGGQVMENIPCNLASGEKVNIAKNINIGQAGFHTLKILGQTRKVKVYDLPAESCVLSLDFNRPDEHTVWDISGFENHGTITGPVSWETHGDSRALQVNTNSLVAFPLSESLDAAGATITLAAWVYPMNENHGYIDFFTKGDYIVFQTENQQLSFFAGGWGRGTCSIPLPGNWLRNWHHIAGVCTGKELKIYLDGKLQQSIPIEGEIESTEIPWNLGRNAEMPYTRRFQGMFDDVKIFKEALTDQDIENLYNQK